MDCVFCAIVDGDLPASRVYEDDRVTAFMDIEPITPGHLLVIPKQHAPHLVDLDPDDAARMMTVAQRLAQALRDSTMPTEGINLFLADGEVALQTVFHAHLHVIPRTPDDGIVLGGDFQRPDRAVLDEQADLVRAQLQF
ncbi:HIT family protein [Luteococcus sp. OSA5]|uniref:HIT family protein n=1 Tax=Luteococcus sp. OSA5 TaxID=3401630 RepID=UPI003B43880F